MKKNIKGNSNFPKDPLVLLRAGLGMVFILAGLHRIIFFEIAYDNFIDLGLKPANLLVIITIIIELASGTLLILNRFILQSSLTLLALLVVGIVAALNKAGENVVQNINEIFMVTATPTDIVLHISYVVGLLTLLLYYKNKN